MDEELRLALGEACAAKAWRRALEKDRLGSGAPEGYEYVEHTPRVTCLGVPIEGSESASCEGGNPAACEYGRISCQREC